MIYLLDVVLVFVCLSWYRFLRRLVFYSIENIIECSLNAILCDVYTRSVLLQSGFSHRIVVLSIKGKEKTDAK